MLPVLTLGLQVPSSGSVTSTTAVGSADTPLLSDILFGAQDHPGIRPLSALASCSVHPGSQTAPKAPAPEPPSTLAWLMELELCIDPVLEASECPRLLLEMSLPPPFQCLVPLPGSGCAAESKWGPLQPSPPLEVLGSPGAKHSPEHIFEEPVSLPPI